MIMLREYQEDALRALVVYLRMNPLKNPLLVLPTGAGKSIIIGEFCRGLLEVRPHARILMATHVKELIVQNYQKLTAIWPMAPAGIYSAGLKSKDLSQQLVFGGVQSLHHAKNLDYFDFLIIDEAHLVPKNAATMYGELIKRLLEIKADTRIIGLTATPFRTSSGMLTEGDDKIFHDIAFDLPIKRLIAGGYLCTPRTVKTDAGFNLANIKTVAGDYDKKQLDEAVNFDEKNVEICKEIARHGKDRKSWLIFCTSVEHARNLADILQAHHFIRADWIAGETESKTRALLLKKFKDGEIKALCNCNLLTTGFDHPGIDMLALVRPTKSPGLYVQMVGRGLRTDDGKTDCLVLDFGENINRHGPIDAVSPVKKGSSGKEKAPVKPCPNCKTMVAISARVCPHCFYEFPAPEAEIETKASTAPILAAPEKREVFDIRYLRNSGKDGKKDTLRVEYETMMGRVPEWVCLEHDPGFARNKADEWLKRRGLHEEEIRSIDDFLQFATDFPESVPTPREITVMRDGKFFRILSIVFSEIPNREAKTERAAMAAIDIDDDLPF